MNRVAQLMLLFTAGSVVGSFVSTAALRRTLGESAWSGRSRCDGCAAPLGFARTLPLVSFAAARGRCAHCRSAISPVHPLGELAGGLAALGLMLMGSWASAALVGIMAAALLAASVIDARTQRLPDGLTIVVAGCAAGLAGRHGVRGLAVGVAAALVAAVVLLGLRGYSAWRRGEPGLGLGDVKLIAALALWLGAWTPAMVGLAALLGLVSLPVAPPRNGRIAFGPMIAVAGWVMGLGMEAGLWPR